MAGQSSAGDITSLCSIAMNAYLTMMLETGHPDTLIGNPNPESLSRNLNLQTRKAHSLLKVIKY